MLASAEFGVGPNVVAYFPEQGVLVREFIEGTTATAEDIRRGDGGRRVADPCRRLHGMFRIREGYLRIVSERRFRLPDGYLDHEPKVRRVEEAMAVRDEGSVPCHNDLLAENFIDAGEGFRLIDYEYAGNNDACFELGNIGSESHLSVNQLGERVALYYGGPLRNKLALARLWGSLLTS
jgi:thiamine kinase-like enzyme